MKIETVRQIDTGQVAMHELDNAARMAALNSWSQMLPLDERYLLAWEAIAQAVAETEQRLRFNEMIHIGINAIDTEARDWLRHHGRNNGRSFTVFWLDWIQAESLFDNAICERLALEQIMAALPERLSRTLIALAIADNMKAAAELLGQHYDTVTRNVREARAAVYAMWFDQEGTPKPPRDRRVETYARGRQQFCVYGHELTPENSYRLGWRGRTCRECQINRQAKRRAKEKARRRAQTNTLVAERRRNHRERS